MHPDFLLRNLDSSQLADWVAFSRVEPFGEGADWLRNARLLAMMANQYRDPRKSKSVSVGDFVPQFGGEEIAGSAEGGAPTTPARDDEIRFDTRESVAEGIQIIGMMARRADKKKRLAQKGRRAPRQAPREA